MITKDTLFIVGAGAHVPYGMPTGAELTKLIIQELPSDVANLGSLRFSAIWAQCFKGESFVTDGFLPMFRAKLEASGHPSIDSFLDAHEENDGIVKTGRLAVAFVLRRLEFQSNRFDQGDQDWMSYLFKGMLEGTDRKNPKDFREKNNVYFVTFNYDRTLEYFFWRRFVASYNEVTPTYFDTMLRGKVEIYHVYGDLGGFDSNTTTRDPSSWPELKKSSDSIELMYSLRGGHKGVIRRVTELLDKCTQIVFLGFGFDEQNINILGLNRDSFANPIAATRMGMTKTEWNRAELKLQPMKVGWNADGSCLALLRNVKLW